MSIPTVQGMPGLSLNLMYVQSFHMAERKRREKTITMQNLRFVRVSPDKFIFLFVVMLIPLMYLTRHKI